MNGWVKLYRQTLDNPIWQRDRTAWQIFEYLLIMAYGGRPQGTVSTTRQQIANACLINNDTVYSALKRLKKAEMITTTSNNQFTVISICNWKKYQLGINKPRQQRINNESTTNQHSYKNKDIRIKKEEVSEARKLADLQLKLTKQKYDFIKKKSPTDSDIAEIDKLHRLDNYDYQLIEAVIKWSASDKFWSRNILSGAKLRKQFERLLIEIKSNRRESYNADIKS